VVASPGTVFWIGMGIAGLGMGILLFVFVPKEKQGNLPDNWLSRTVGPFRIVFSNPQSILCGLIAGAAFYSDYDLRHDLGVRYLQEAHGLDYARVVIRSSAVPFGWIIGCPLLGFISDRLGRRKPVIMGGAAALLACVAWMLFGRTGVFPPYAVGLMAGLASGAAMLPYSVIKEVNPPQYGGTATGVINFLNFTFSALLGPVFAWILQHVSGWSRTNGKGHYQSAFAPLLLGIAAAIVLSSFSEGNRPCRPRAVPRAALEVQG